MEWKNKRLLVAGMGKSGRSVMEAALALGARAALYDQKNEDMIDSQLRELARQKGMDCYFGILPPEEEEFDALVVSPGIPMTQEIVLYAKRKNIPVLGELELAWELSRGRWIAITGTNGKTTTTSLVGEILRQAGKDVRVVGNIGTAAISQVLSSDESTWFAAEVSSFQLETIRQFHPAVSAVLNITADHLNRHGSMEGYINAKARIFENQGPDDFFVVNRDCPEAFALAKQTGARVFPFSVKESLEEGCFVQKGHILARREGKEEILGSCGDLQIPGVHNLENALAAAAMCWCAGIGAQAIREGLKSFQGVEHRIEYVDTIDGVSYYNDSKGTNTDAASKAIDAMRQSIILIAGGYDKGESFESWIRSFQGRVKHMMLLGQTAPLIAQAARNESFFAFTQLPDLASCVREASQMARPGDVVLLSPACASWGMYENYEQRGREFKALVKEIRRRKDGTEEIR